MKENSEETKIIEELYLFKREIAEMTEEQLKEKGKRVLLKISESIANQNYLELEKFTKMNALLRKEFDFRKIKNTSLYEDFFTSDKQIREMLECIEDSTLIFNIMEMVKRYVDRHEYKNYDCPGRI